LAISATVAIAIAATTHRSTWTTRALAPRVGNALFDPNATRREPDSRPHGIGADDVQRLSNQIWRRAGAIEADLLRPSDNGVRDLLSEREHDLSRRAAALERDILFGRLAPFDVNDSLPTQENRR
jgi:hypothetical protein